MSRIEWPTGQDLIDWVGEATSDALAAMADEIMLDATDDALARISSAALPKSNRPGGSNPDCPRRLRRALIMEGGRLYARRSTRAGFQISKDTIVRITSVDPDIEKYMSTLTNWPSP